jgi:4-amino-4-deoxy-L-arabinose transferase-like glycosyltransferase
MNGNACRTLPAKASPVSQEPRPASVRVPLLRALPWSLLLLLGCGLLLRLALLPLFSTIGPGTYDEKDFNQLARNILQHGEYAFEPGHLTSLRPPLYPAFVAGVYSVAGLENYQAVRLVQIVLGLFTAVFVYYLSRELFDSRTAFLAAGLCLAYPSLWCHGYLLLTEALFTFLLSLALLFFVGFFRDDRLIDLGMGAVLLGLAALTRSAMSLFPPLFLLLLLCARELSWRRRLAAVVVFLAAFGGTLAPWIIRNTVVQGAFTLVDTSGGKILAWTLSEYKPDPAPAKAQAASAEAPSAEATGEGSVAGPVNPPTEEQQDRRALARSLRFLYEKPLILVTHAATNFFRFWRLDREVIAGAGHGNFGPVPKPLLIVLAVVVCGAYVAIMLTGVLGLALFPSRNRLGAALVLLTGAHICLIHSLVYGHARYHIVIIPLVGVFSAAFLARYREMFALDRRRRLLAGGLGWLLLLVPWLVQLYQDDLPALVRVLGY